MRRDVINRLIVAAFAAIMTVETFAAPFDRWFEHRITDGRTIRIHGVGDEYAARFTDEEGRNLIYNPQAGAYEYAEREDDETFRRRALELRLKDEEETGLAKRWAELKASRHQKSSSKPRLMSPPSHQTLGTVVGLTILVDFPVLDEYGNEVDTLANRVHPGVTVSDLNDLLNGTGFKKYGNYSSVREYFYGTSGGNLTYTNIVIGWIKAPHPREHYDDPTRNCGSCGQTLVRDAIYALTADPRYYTEYCGLIRQATANEFGQVRALNIFFAGEESSEWRYGLWAHKSRLTPVLELNVGENGQNIYRTFIQYQITPVTSSPSIGTFCHESGHLVCDFPDLYDYSFVSGGVQSFCLMCSHFDKTPQNVCAYLRAAAGWVTPDEETPYGVQRLTSRTVTLNADQQNVWKFPHPTDPQQYYLAENRQATGRDQSLPASGIVIYRCDESGSNTVSRGVSANSIFSDYGNAIYRRSYEVSVEQADGLYEIERGLPADANDTWFAGNSATRYYGLFNATSKPCARWRNGTPAGLTLRDFSANGSSMTFYYICSTYAPLNDHVNMAIPISGLSGTTSGELLGATVESNEPLPKYRSEATNTVWWVWTADYDGTMTFDTDGSLRSDNAYLTTAVGVYTNSNPSLIASALKKAADECVNTSSSRHTVTLNAKAGVRYYICVSSLGTETGTAKLTWRFEKPANDDFADAIQIAGLSGTATGVNRKASVQSSDPLLNSFGSSGPRSSVWWKWTAPSKCTARFNTEGSWYEKDQSSVYSGGGTKETMHAYLGAYTCSGNSLQTAVAVAEDCGENFQRPARIEFIAEEGTTYYICVSGDGVNQAVNNNWFGAGHIVLQWNFAPANDDYENAAVISGRSGSVACSNTNATIQANEPLALFLEESGASAANSVWWKWTAPETGDAVFDTIGSYDSGSDLSMDTALGVYTKDGVGFQLIAHNDNLDDLNDNRSRVAFHAYEGTTYYICVAAIDYSSYGLEASVGEIRLNWNLAQRIQRISSTIDTISYATVQEVNPLSEYEPTAANSGWFSYDPGVAGNLTFDTTGSQLAGGGMMDTAICIYTNAPSTASSEGGLVKIWENDNINLRTTSGLTFKATAGVRHYICVEQRGGSEAGTVQLNMKRGSSTSREFVDLALLGFDTTISHGTTIYGTLGGNYRVSIAPGATVALSNAVINGVDGEGCRWAGLTCEGDAKLVLKGANSVRGFDRVCPGIFVPSGSRLEINGTGSLTACSNGRGAGIGGGSNYPCNEGGDIYIYGGTITATGGEGCAGIGSGAYSFCGDIRIAGGSVSATGGDGAAGIGSGTELSFCGDISIEEGATRVVATCGTGCSNPIGAGDEGSCGTVDVTLADGMLDDEGVPTRTIAPLPWDGNLATLTFNAIAVDGMTIYGTLGGNYKVSIAHNATVTLDGATINGMNFYAYKWAGITCIGDATIILAGENSVSGFYEDYPGIYIPEGNMLTIQGTGSLSASGSVGTNGKRWAAGIGGGYDISCGEIVIESGTITATGGNGSAGIGGGYLRDASEVACGDITILGGTINATGGLSAAAIGSGFRSTCGDIFILGGVVTAVGGNGAAGIGAGDAMAGYVENRSSCGDIHIEGGDVTAVGNGGAAGIGCGAYNSDCGDINIEISFEEDPIRVVATCGDDCSNPIGASADESCTCGTVTVDPNLDSVLSNNGRTLTITTPVPVVWDGNLATLDDNVTVTNGMTLYGTLQGYYKVSVEAGATVTLSNATISLEQRQDCEWAGLNCLGDAQIVLAAASTNTVKGCQIQYPGIHVPVGSTLTIAGRGTLNASSNGRGAGIGGGWNISCGNIVINGGTVTAVGGTYCAGIGGGYPYQIAVTCGSITIGNGIAKVVATQGTSGVNPIGAGLNSTCGTVTIAPDLLDDNETPTRTIVSDAMGNDYKSFATRAGYGEWDAENYTRGTYNVFLYAFGILPMSPSFVLIDIEFNDDGKAVIKTPPLKNNVSYVIDIVATDSVDGSGNKTSYALDPSGKTVINETNKTKRFFRLRATPR